MKSWKRLASTIAVVSLGCSSGDGDSGSRANNQMPTGGSAAGLGSSAGDGSSGFGNAGATQTERPPTAGAAGMENDEVIDPMGMTTSIPPISIDDCGDANPAGLSADQVQSLMAGGGAAPRMLYPYDGTVFPRGMLPPTLMWDGGAPIAAGDPTADAVYIHMKSTHFEWHGCVQPTGPNQLELPAEVWKAAWERTLGTGDPYQIELTTSTGGTIDGPATIAVTIAQATIKGSIFYNSYASAQSIAGGAIFRIPPGGMAELFIGGNGCYGCHTVSANGERLISHGGFVPDGLSYAIDPSTQPNPPQLSSSPLAGFTGLSPDGSVYVASAHPTGEARPQGTPNEAVLINDAALYETDTGMLLSGSGIPSAAMMPTFSPDGTLLVFSDGAMAGRVLTVMDFDQAGRTASAPRTIFTDTDRYAGWPFVLPDSKAVVFARGVNGQYSGAGAGVIPGTQFLGPESDLYIVDIATGDSTLLARAMGFADASDTTGYVPFGAEDLHRHYYPTVSPVAAGGYFWVFFDSIRHYGNLGQFRQLWGTAISISPTGQYSTDPSHPAFYLPGQEFATGNHRAFAALDACKQDGNDCTTGIDCCGGFCTIPEKVDEEFAAEPVGTCGPPPEKGCSRTDARCTTDADCCPPDPGKVQNSCIAGYCAYIPVVE